MLRFFVIYTLISIVAWALETTRQGYEKELSRQNKEIHKQKDFFAALLETLPNPFFIKDAQGRYQGCNKAFEKMLNTKRERIIGKTVFDISPADVAQIYYEKDNALMKAPGIQIYESLVKPPNGGEKNVIFHKSTYVDRNGSVEGIMGIVFDITELREAEAEKTKLIHDLESALAEIKTLSGMLPICASCKKIRDDKGSWNQIDAYIQEHSDATFSHSMCPDCSDTFYGEEDWYIKMKTKKNK